MHWIGRFCSTIGSEAFCGRTVYKWCNEFMFKRVSLPDDLYVGKPVPAVQKKS
jgi:hypothetical protein